jgi:hypothetical protein
MDENEEYQEETQLSSEPVSPQEVEQLNNDEPRPENFEDYDEFVRARIDFAIKKAAPQGDQARVTAEAVAQGVAQALQPQVTFMDRLNADIDAKKPDDELFGPRTTAVEWIEMCKKEEAKAKLDGDENRARDWKQRSKWGVDEIERLGKSEAEKYAEEVHADVDLRSINLLFDKNKVDDKMWDTPKMQHDAGIVINRHNERNKQGLIALPLEAAAWGDVLPVHPKNMCQIQLPPQAFESFKNLVYHSGGENTPAEVFKRSWKALRRLGYAGTAKPAFEAKKKQKSDEPETDPEKMTQKEYEAWRTKSEKKTTRVMFPKKR